MTEAKKTTTATNAPARKAATTKAKPAGKAAAPGKAGAPSHAKDKTVTVTLFKSINGNARVASRHRARPRPAPE